MCLLIDSTQPRREAGFADSTLHIVISFILFSHVSLMYMQRKVFKLTPLSPIVLASRTQNAESLSAAADLTDFFLCIQREWGKASSATLILVI